MDSDDDRPMYVDMPEEIKAIFAGEVGETVLPIDIMNRAQGQGITKEILTTRGRRYVTMRLEDLDSAAPDEACVGLTLEIQDWLESNIVNRMRGSDEQQHQPSPVQHDQQQELAQPRTLQRQQGMVRDKIESLDKHFMRPASPVFGPTPFALENFLPPKAQELFTMQQAERKAVKSNSDPILAFGPNTGNEDSLEARTALRDELEKEESSEEFLRKFNSIITDEAFDVEFANFNWGGTDIEPSSVQQAIVTRKQVSKLDSVREVPDVTSLRTVEDDVLSDASMDISSDDSTSSPNQEKRDFTLDDDNITKEVSYDSNKKEKAPSNKVSLQNMRSRHRKPEETALPTQKGFKGQAGRNKDSRPIRSKSNKNVFAAVESTKRRRLDSPPPGDLWSWGKASHSMSAPRSFAPPRSFVPPRTSTALSMQNAQSFAPPPSLQPRPLRATGSPYNYFSGFYGQEASMLSGSSVGLYGQGGFSPPPPPSLPSSQPMTIPYDANLGPGFNDPGMYNPSYSNFTESQMGRPQPMYNLSYEEGRGGYPANPRGRGQHRPRGGSGRENAPQRGSHMYSYNNGIQGGRGRGGLSMNYTPNPQPQNPSYPMTGPQFPGSYSQTMPPWQNNTVHAQGNYPAAHRTQIQRVNDSPIPFNLPGPTHSPTVPRRQRGMFQFEIPEEGTNFMRILQEAKVNSSQGRFLMVEADFNPHSTSVIVVASEGTKVVTLLKDVLGAEEYLKYSAGFKLV